MRFLNLILLLLVVSSYSSCKKKDLGDCFKSTGEIIEQQREVGEFSKIILLDNVNLVLSPSESDMLIVSAGENLMDKIITEVNDNALTVSNTNSCNWVRDFDVPITVYLSVGRLNEIEYRSIGDINCTDTIFSDTLEINVYEGAGTLNILTNTYQLRTSLHYGTADIKLSGRCRLSYVYSAGWGLIDNRALISKQVYVGNNSSNDIYLSAVHTLAATVQGIGNIYYTGNPENISFNQIGSGQLIKLEQ